MATMKSVRHVQRVIAGVALAANLDLVPRAEKTLAQACIELQIFGLDLSLS